MASAKSLLRGEPLSAAEAGAKKIDGPPGFYLATEVGDAEYFASRRTPGAVLEYSIPDSAMTQLLEAGAKLQPIPIGLRSPMWAGKEFVIPPKAFGLFNDLFKAKKITVQPSKD